MNDAEIVKYVKEFIAESEEKYKDELPKYISRYNHNLKIIKHLLNIANEILNKINTQLKKIKKQIQKIDFYKSESFDDSITDQMVIALYMRLILEIMLSRFIGNNDKQLKNKLDNKNGRYSRIIEKLEEVDSNIIFVSRIEDITNLDKSEELQFKKNNFWTKDNLIHIYDKLSYHFLHFSHELHENFKIIKSKDMNEFYEKVYKKVRKNFNYLLNIYNQIYNSLQNHITIVKVGNDLEEFIFEVNEFKVTRYFPKSIFNSNNFN